LLLSIAGLFLVGAGLGVRLLRAGLRAASLATEQRLRAIGLTAAQALAQGASTSLLGGVTRDNELEAAYMLDAKLHPVSVAAGGSFAVNLLRIDPDRALRALRGQAQVGAAYHLEAAVQGADDSVVLAGYFPVVAKDGSPRILVLEAGAAFVALPAQLRATAWAAGATAFGLAALCALLVMASLRAASREERLQAEAERGQTLREMAAMVAHEIRNPLGTIRAGTELLREQATSVELFDDILAEVARLSDLTTQFLQFSRDPPLAISPIDLGALGDELCTHLRRAHRDEAALQILREGDAAVPICGDADRLRQVLQNLARNAIEAMQGRGTLHIIARRTADGGELQVRDSGPGVDEAARRSLFVPFRSGKPSGTGLGLIICRRIVEKHGGSLLLSSADADIKGACFIVRLPKNPPAALAQPS
jgi:signal transduction histidine kinase